MKRLYQENSEFGEYRVFDTEKGVLLSVSKEEFHALKMFTEQSDLFVGSSASHTVFPRRIYFQITRRCNLLCPYCFIKADQFEKDLPQEVIMRSIPYLSREGLMEVRLTGGEPTLLKHFIQVVESFQLHHVYVSVATNGLWSKEVLDYFGGKSNLWLIVSIDGDRENHNALRTDSYDKIVDNLICLRKKNRQIRIRFNTVLTRDNVHTIESIFRLGALIDVESITFIPLRPQVRKSSMRPKMLTAEEFQTAVINMIRWKKKYKVDFTTTIETIYKDEIMSDKVFMKTSSCAAGREGMNLDYDWDKGEFLVYGCSYSPACDTKADPRIRKPFIAGSMPFDQIESLGRIWQEDERWELFRNLKYKSSECNSCQYYRERCTGSCPIQNVDFSALNIREDVLQQLTTQMQQNGEWYCYKKFLS